MSGTTRKPSTDDERRNLAKRHGLTMDELAGAERAGMSASEYAKWKRVKNADDNRARRGSA